MLVEEEFFGVATCLSSLGIGFCVLLLVFNVKYKHLRFVRMTSPSVNILIIVGGALGYVSTSLLAFSHTDTAVMEAIKSSLTWTLPMSVTLIFGSMFAKAWRVYRLFEQSSVKRVTIPDSLLFQIIACLLLVNVILSTVWILVDPIHCLNVSPSAEINSTDTDEGTTVTASAVMHCSSLYTNAWLASTAVYAYIVITIASVVAWRVRLVNFPALDDGRTTLICAQTCCALGACAVCLVYALGAERPIIGAGLACLMLYAGVTGCLVVTFVPKAYQVLSCSDSPPLAYVGARYIDGTSSGDFEMEVYRILSENENLRKQLYEKENLIATLKKVAGSETEDHEGRQSQSSHVYSIATRSDQQTLTLREDNDDTDTSSKTPTESGSDKTESSTAKPPIDSVATAGTHVTKAPSVQKERPTLCCSVKYLLKYCTYCCVSENKDDTKVGIDGQVEQSQPDPMTSSPGYYSDYDNLSRGGPYAVDGYMSDYQQQTLSRYARQTGEDNRASGLKPGEASVYGVPLRRTMMEGVEPGELIIGSIADTFQLPDDSDTHSYISSYISKSHYKYKQRNRPRNGGTARDSHHYLHGHRHHCQHHHQNKAGGDNCHSSSRDQSQSGTPDQDGNLPPQVALSCDQLYPDDGNTCGGSSSCESGRCGKKGRIHKAMLRSRDTYKHCLEKGNVTLV